ncbi:MAG TPA: 2-isopropylmalate synthase [Terriglobales bacterium]|nr:2-isopropylmalate synthase [Terriglobales bacterium]
MERERITIFDTTLRDGEQSPGCSMNVEEKLRMARQLDRLGVDIIEAGFPIASDGDFEAVRAIAASVRRPIIAGLARARREDIERAWDALKHAASPRIHIFLATSDIHLQYKLKISREECVEQARDAVAFAKSLCADVEFSPEDATRTDPEFLLKIVQAVVDAGATTVNIPDTVGYTTPSEFGELIQTIRTEIRGIESVTISAHCHNDLGLAVANSLAAVSAGARQVECTINGIGERAGNASLEEIVMALHVRPEKYPYETEIDTTRLFPISQLLSETTNVEVQPNKAIIGRNAFAHEAGIHQDGMLKNPLTYEIMTPQSVGVPDSRLVLGKHSGRHALGLKCAALGFELDRRQLDDVYRRFVVLADKIKQVEDHHLLQLVRESQDREIRIPPAHVEATARAAAAALAGSTTAHRASAANIAGLHSERKPSDLPLHPMAEHHEEDYLWGV